MNVLFGTLAASIWGTTYILATQLLPGVEPGITAMMRALPAGLFLLLLKPGLPDQIFRQIILGLLNIGVFFWLLFEAAYRIPGAIVATIGAIQPLVAMLLGAVLLKRKLSWWVPLMVIIGGTGIWLLSSGSASTLDPIGILYATGAAISMAVGVVLNRVWTKPGKLLTNTAWQLLFGGIFLAILSVQHFAEIANFTSMNWLGVLILAGVNTAIGYLLWFAAAGKTAEPWKLTMMGVFSPLVATVLGTSLLGELLSIRQIVGVLAILVAVLISQLIPSGNHGKPKSSVS